MSSRCGSFNPELHCCYEVGIHKTPRHHNTGDRDGGFDPSDDTCLPSYLRPLTRLYDATKRDAHRQGKIAQEILRSSHGIELRVSVVGVK